MSGNPIETGGPAIECHDETRQPYGWQFYCRDFGGIIRKVLDPQRTLQENRVEKNSIIIARRISLNGKF